MRGSPKVTIYTVAERAGVSISTVSLAINAPHRVSEQTRVKVIAAAGALGYRTASARRPVAGMRIAVAAPFTTYQTYFRRFAGMLLRARDTAIELAAHDLPSAASAKAPLLDALPARGGIDGLIVMGVPLGSAALRASRDAALPLVLVDVRRARPVGEDPPVVLLDDEAGGRLAGEHLRARGHHHVVYLGEPLLSRDYIAAGQLRMRGLSDHVRITPIVCELDADPTARLREVLSGADAPTAIMANHDELAARAWHGLRAEGFSVPGDVAILGFDDGPLAQALDLTTVRQPFEESGRLALEMLIDTIAQPTRSIQRMELAPSLIVRTST